MERLLRLVSGLLIGVVIARYLGPQQFGLFNYIIALTTIFAAISRLGLDSIMVLELVQNPNKKNEILGTGFWTKLIGSISTFLIIVFVSSIFIQEKNVKNYLIIVSSAYIFQSLEVLDFYFQSIVKLKYTSIAKLLQLMCSILIKCYLLVYEFDLTWFILSLAIESFLISMFYVLVFTRNENLDFFGFFNISQAKSMLKKSWPLLFTSLVVMIYMRIDQIMIRDLLGDYDSGIYSVGVRISEIYYFLPMIICTSLFPSILRAKQESYKKYIHRMSQLYFLLFWMALTLAVIFFTFASSIVTLLFGVEYLDAINVLKILVWSTIFVFLGVASSKWLLTENLQHYELYNTSLGAFLNIILNLYLLPKYGIIGAAYATVISYALAAVLMLALWKKTRPNFKLIVRGIIISNNSLFR